MCKCCPSAKIAPPWATMFKIRLSDAAVLWWSSNTYTLLSNNSELQSTSRCILPLPDDRVIEAGRTLTNLTAGEVAILEDLGASFDRPVRSSSVSGADTTPKNIAISRACIDSTGNYAWLASSTSNRVRMRLSDGAMDNYKQETASTVSISTSRPSRHSLISNSSGGVTMLQGTSPSLLTRQVRAFNVGGTQTGTTSVFSVNELVATSSTQFAAPYQQSAGQTPNRLALFNRATCAMGTSITLETGAILTLLDSDGSKISGVVRGLSAYVARWNASDLSLEWSTADSSVDQFVDNSCIGVDAVYTSRITDAGAGHIRKFVGGRTGPEWTTAIMSGTIAFGSATFQMREHDGVLYVSGAWSNGTDFHQLMALDAATGDVLWRRRLTRETNVLTSQGFEFAIRDEHLYLACNGTVRIK